MHGDKNNYVELDALFWYHSDIHSSGGLSLAKLNCHPHGEPQCINVASFPCAKFTKDHRNQYIGKIFYWYQIQLLTLLNSGSARILVKPENCHLGADNIE